MVKIIDVRSLDNSKYQSNNFSAKVVAIEEKEENKEIRLSLFCEKTTLHGWKYFYSEPSKLPKFVWLFAIIGALTLSAYFTKLNVEEFMTSTTRSSIASTTASLQEIIFPSVYVCNINQVLTVFCFYVTFRF